jgi:murein DD-endopeptidase MepM/ murein hydrolase activator NlpD
VPEARARWLALAALALLAACETRGGPPAPVTQGGGTRPALSRAEASSGMVVAQRGDTLYAVARRANVPVRALIDANGLRPPYALQPGQQLRLPRGGAAPAGPSSQAPQQAARADQQAQPSAPRGAVAVAPLPAPAAPAPAETRGGRPPAGGEAEGSVQPAPQPPAAAQPPVQPPQASAPVAPPIDARPQARAAGRFLWPVRGDVVSSFGAKPGGLQNDGINIAAGLGTPVRAAENGVVVYAGNELRGFGNLVLLRHADGWMSAYAHLDEIGVERGAQVQRGQGIGKVGQSGSVSSPQLHFELRRDGRPVDPRPHMSAGG